LDCGRGPRDEVREHRLRWRQQVVGWLRLSEKGWQEEMLVGEVMEKLVVDVPVTGADYQ
jgi:hypothetical protein